MTTLSSENSQGSAKLNILIADDHALVRGGLTLLIDMATPGSQVIEANNIEQVNEHLSSNPSIDLMLLDLMMPGMHGIDGVRLLSGKWPGVPIIVVSVTEDAHTIRQALAAGAAGYIPKSSEPNVTIAAMKLVLDGGVYIPPHVLAQSVDAETTNDSLDDESDKGVLSRRQLEVLTLIQSGKSNNAIAEELGLSTGTVKMHVSGIFKKLKVSNRTEAVAIFSQLENDGEAN